VPLGCSQGSARTGRRIRGVCEALAWRPCVRPVKACRYPPIGESGAQGLSSCQFRHKDVEIEILKNTSRPFPLRDLQFDIHSTRFGELQPFSKLPEKWLIDRYKVDPILNLCRCNPKILQDLNTRFHTQVQHCEPSTFYSMIDMLSQSTMRHICFK